MKQTKEDKEQDVFDSFSNRELLLNFRRNLEKTKQLASSAVNRANNVEKDLRDMQSCLSTDLYNSEKYNTRIQSLENEIIEFLNLPWYKRIFYKRSK